MSAQTVTPAPFTDLELLEMIQRRGNLAPLRVPPAVKPALYQHLADLGWLARDRAKGGPNFWLITAAGHAAIAAAIPAPPLCV